MKGACSRVKERRSLHSRIAVLLPITVLLALAFGPFIVQKASSIWPPASSIDMWLYEDGEIGSWGNQNAEYAIFKHFNEYKYVGLTYSEWTTGWNFGLDYHYSLISVEKGDGSFASGKGSRKTTDPYGYLPRSGQTWEYNSQDDVDYCDKLGWSLSQSWVELPKTSVPAMWTRYGSEDPYVTSIFITDPNCWIPGNPIWRSGVTFESSESYPDDLYMRFSVYYESRQHGWWDCYGNTYHDYASKTISLV